MTIILDSGQEQVSSRLLSPWCLLQALQVTLSFHGTTMISSSFWEGEEEAFMALNDMVSQYLMCSIKLLCHLHQTRIRVCVSLSLRWFLVGLVALDHTICSLITLCDND